jgi:hypothetical protein
VPPLLDRRRAALAAAAAAVALLASASQPPEPLALSTASAPGCAGTVVGRPQSAPAPGRPCWVDVTPYPFGSDGNATTAGGSCATCLQVTSLAFRAWNRGLAAVAPTSGTTPFVVWLWNGTRWFPDPTFPGPSTCAGNTVLWAGKLDYWLIGTGASWAGLCRFDGVDFLWQPLKLPAATLARVPLQSDGKTRKTGGITSGTCFSWDDCWFFGSFGTVVHWDGKQLTDASPGPAVPGPEYTSAASTGGSDGDGVGLAVAKSGDNAGRPLPGTPPGQLFTSSGDEWAATPFAPPTDPQPGDPYRTDLVAVALGANGEGWAAGNPPGWPLSRPNAPATPGARAVADVPEPAPLVPLAGLGADPDCAGPGPTRFAHTGSATGIPPAGAYPDSYLWTSVSVVPGSGDAIAGGQLRPGSADPLEPPAAGVFDAPEPVLVDAGCDGSVTVTRFLKAGGSGLVPVEPSGAVTAVAANAVNDAWAATAGHLYRLTDGTPPQAPAGDDNESRPLQLQEDPPVIVFAPLPPPAPPPAPVTTAVTTTTLAPAIDGVKAKVQVGKGRRTFTLDVSFRVSRKITLGLQALRGKRVVASAKLTTFAPPRGKLVVALRRSEWPTGLRFTTDSPTVKLANPGATLSGTTTLSATAAAIRGRSVASVRFDYAVAASNAWVTIGTATAPPFRVPFDTSKLAAGYYDLRAVATDSAGVVAVSNEIPRRQVGG